MSEDTWWVCRDPINKSCWNAHNEDWVEIHIAKPIKNSHAGTQPFRWEPSVPFACIARIKPGHMQALGLEINPGEAIAIHPLRVEVV